MTLDRNESQPNNCLRQVFAHGSERDAGQAEAFGGGI